MNNAMQYFKNQEDDMLSDLKSFIDMETPSTDKELLDKFAEYLKNYIKERSLEEPDSISSSEVIRSTMLFFISLLSIRAFNAYIVWSNPVFISNIPGPYPFPSSILKGLDLMVPSGNTVS